MSTPSPQPKAKEFNLDGLKTWLATHQWAEWVIGILGVIGMIIVAYWLLKHPSKEEEK